MNIPNIENNKIEVVNLEQNSPADPISSTNLSCNLDLIPSASYFINKNQTKQEESELLNRIDSYIEKIETFETNKSIKSKKLRIMSQEDLQQQPPQTQDEECQNEAQTLEETTNEKIKKGRSLLRKSNRHKLIKQLTQDSEKAASDANDSATEEDASSETKKNTLANRNQLNAKYTHLFFFKADCPLSSLSKQIVKSFNNFEFDQPDINQQLNTTTDDEDRQKSVDKSDLSQSENEETTGEHASRSRARSRQSANRKPKMSRIVRLDLSEVDASFEDPKNTTTKIEYLDDMFKENSISKFYAFKRTANLSTLYLATNIAVSMSSIDSDSSIDDETKDIASIHFTREEVSIIRRESVAQHESILNNKNFVTLIQNKQKEANLPEENEVNKMSLKKKLFAIKQATMEKIRSRSNSKKKRRAKSEADRVNNEDLFRIDLRDYNQEEKKKEINDPALDLFLESRIVSQRRSAITSRIDKYFRGGELITYMENLLRQEYIENFLL